MRLLAGNGRAIQLGPELKQGGEATIFQVVDQADVLCKVYSRQPTEQQLAKLETMVNMAAPDHCAWPLEIVRRDGQVVGFTMRRLSDTHPIHEVFSPRDRLNNFGHVPASGVISH